MMNARFVFLVTMLAWVGAMAVVAPKADGAEPAPVRKGGGVVMKFDLEHLLQHWVHSVEEQKDPNTDELIYRPAESREFPPSRFRMAYKFAKNGECEWMFLDPADNHHFKPGKWEVRPGDVAVLVITTQWHKRSFRIIELSKEILRMAPVKADE